MQVRRMLKWDVPAVVAIELDDDQPWDEAAIRAAYRARHSSSWVVETDSGRVVGYCIATSDWMVTSILRFRVDSGFRGAGGGTELLKSLIGATMATCSIEAAVGKDESAAQVLLSRNGFKCVNERDDDYIFRRGDRFLHAPDLKYRMTTRYPE